MKHRLLFLAALLLSTPVFAAPVRLAGQVINDTVQKPAAGATLEFVKAQDGNTPTLVTKARSAADGKFAVTLNLTPKDLVFARINWTGHMYVAPVYDGDGKLAATGMKVNPQNLKLRVFDTTRSLVPLSFMVHHLAINSEAGGIKCVERIVVENPTRKMFLGLGERRATILLNLPAAAQNVRLDPEITDAKIEKRPDGYAIIKPIAPSVGNSAERNLVIINYEMKWPSNLPWERELDFSRKIQYPTRFFFVAREDADKKLKITAPKLSADQSAPLNVEGQPQTRLVNAIGRPAADGAPALQAGDDLKIQIASPVEPLFWGFLAFVVLLIAAVPAVIFRRARPVTKNDIKIAEPPNPESVSMQPFATGDNVVFSAPQQNLIERLAQLDDEYSRGQISAEEYAARRAQWKGELVEQLLQTPQPEAQGK